MINFILPVIGCFTATVLVIYIQWRYIASKNRKIAELHRRNNVLKEELNHANIRKEIEQNTTRLSDAAVDDSLQQDGYYRD